MKNIGMRIIIVHCPECQALMAAYLDKEEEIKTFVGQCPECEEYFEFRRDLGDPPKVFGKKMKKH